jgi:hypothetical protein
VQGFPDDILRALRPRSAWRTSELLGTSRTSRGRLVVIRGAIASATAARWGALLERELLPGTSRLTIPIPADAITRMRENYSELLPKVTRVRTAALLGRKSRAMGAARRLGLYAMLRSDGVRAIAEEALRGPVGKRCGAQVFRYEAGDYQGPHNDNQPEDPTIARGYVDVQLSVPSRTVASQLLVYERDGQLNQVVDVAREPLVLVYVLPFWHHVTPLVPAPGARAARAAHRWLLIGSFERADDDGR